MASSSSSTLLSLVLLVAWCMAGAQGGRLQHMRLYMQETRKGPSVTLFGVVPPKGNTTFGIIALLDDELFDGPNPSNATLLGRFQGMGAFAGHDNPPGMQSVISFVFTAGRYKGSTVVMVGTVVSFEGTFERAVVGGTGAFRMAQGYCGINALWNPTGNSTVYQVDIFMKTDRHLQQQLLRADA